MILKSTCKLHLCANKKREKPSKRILKGKVKTELEFLSPEEETETIHIKYPGVLANMPLHVPHTRCRLTQFFHSLMGSRLFATHAP